MVTFVDPARSASLLWSLQNKHPASRQRGIGERPVPSSWMESRNTYQHNRRLLPVSCEVQATLLLHTEGQARWTGQAPGKSLAQRASGPAQQPVETKRLEPQGVEARRLTGWAGSRDSCPQQHDALQYGDGPGVITMQANRPENKDKRATVIQPNDIDHINLQGDCSPHLYCP